MRAFMDCSATKQRNKFLLAFPGPAVLGWGGPLYHGRPNLFPADQIVGKRHARAAGRSRVTGGTVVLVMDVGYAFCGKSNGVASRAGIPHHESSMGRLPANENVPD